MRKKILLAMLLSMFLLSAMTVPSLSLDVTVGVAVGDWFIYEASVYDWWADEGVPFPPDQTFVGFLYTYNETEWQKYTVTDVAGSNVTFDILSHWKNGTETTDWLEQNITSGAWTFVVGANLEAGDQVKDEYSLFGVVNYPPRYLNESVMVEYGDLTREANVLDYEHPTFLPTTSIHSRTLWDKETGILVKHRQTFLNNTSPGVGDYSVTFEIELVETNLWECAQPLPYDWPMLNHDAQHTAYSESPAPVTNQTLWNVSIGAILVASPTVADGRVYFGAYDGKVYCLDAATGASIWNYTTGGTRISSSAAVADGKVYSGCQDCNVYCLDAATGTLLWNYTTGGRTPSSPVVVDGKVYIGSRDDNIYCLDAATGALVWNYTTGNDVTSSPAVADGRVYAGSDDYNVYCWDAATGAQIWNYSTGGSVYGSPTVADDKVYVGSHDCNVYCLDADTGEKIWNHTFSDDAYGGAVAYGNVYVGSYDDNIYCLDADTGALVWNYTTTGDAIVPAVADGKVYVGSSDYNVYCLNASTGALIWSYTTGSMIFSSPAVANGVVYISGGGAGVFYAFSDLDAPIPEGLTFGAMLLLSTVAAIVGIHYLQKRPKWKRW